MSLGFHVVLCAPAVCSVGSRLSLPQSRDGLFFGLINLVGNFSTVFIDQSYWQSAIAATPSASWKGFLLGGLCWFAIPYVFVACFFFLACFAPSLRPIKTWANSSSPTAAVCAHVTGRCCYLRWPLGSSWVAVTDAFDSCLFILAGLFVGLPVACCVCGSGCRCTFWAACLSSSCIVTACHVAGLVCVLVVDGLTSLVSFCAWPSSILPVPLFSWCNLCCWHWFCVPLAVCLCRVVLCA